MHTLLQSRDVATGLAMTDLLEW